VQKKNRDNKGQIEKKKKMGNKKPNKKGIKFKTKKVRKIGGIEYQSCA
jgi:hypothetical protein